MVFHGFQKMTMLDFPGLVACTVFTAGCNFRCPFCHNSPLVTDITDDEIHTEDEILEYLHKRKGILDGICISGGEPLMHDGLFDFLKKVRETGLKIKLDTNGSYPDKLREIVSAGLVDYVAMDIKNCPSKYPVTAGSNETAFENVRKSVTYLLNGNIPYEFRTTVVKEFHTLSDMWELGRFIEGAEKYYIQQFIDSERNISQGLTPFAREELENVLESVRQYVKFAEIRGV